MEGHCKQFLLVHLGTALTKQRLAAASLSLTLMELSMSGGNLSSHVNNYDFFLVGFQRSMAFHGPTTLGQNGRYECLKKTDKSIGKIYVEQRRRRPEDGIGLYLKEICDKFDRANSVQGSQEIPLEPYFFISSQSTLHVIGYYPVSASLVETDSFHCLLGRPKPLLPA